MLTTMKSYLASTIFVCFLIMVIVATFGIFDTAIMSNQVAFGYEVQPVQAYCLRCY